MNKIRYSEFLLKIESIFAEDGKKNYALHGPLTEKYWDDEYRILFCNLESYNQNGRRVVDIEQFLGWYGAPTCKYTAKWNYFLKMRLSGKLISKNIIVAHKDEENNIQEELKKIAYINYRFTSNHEVAQNIKKIYYNAKKFKDILQEQIYILNPHIVLIGGHVGISSHNVIFNDSLEYNSFSIINNILFCSIRHPSKMDYNYMANKINEIVKVYKKVVNSQ